MTQEEFVAAATRSSALAQMAVDRINGVLGRVKTPDCAVARARFLLGQAQLFAVAAESAVRDAKAASSIDEAYMWADAGANDAATAASLADQVYRLIGASVSQQYRALRTGHAELPRASARAEDAPVPKTQAEVQADIDGFRKEAEAKALEAEANALEAAESARKARDAFDAAKAKARAKEDPNLARYAQAADRAALFAARDAESARRWSDAVREAKSAQDAKASSLEAAEMASRVRYWARSAALAIAAIAGQADAAKITSTFWDRWGA